MARLRTAAAALLGPATFGLLGGCTDGAGAGSDRGPVGGSSAASATARQLPGPSASPDLVVAAAARVGAPYGATFTGAVGLAPRGTDGWVDATARGGQLIHVACAGRGPVRVWWAPVVVAGSASAGPAAAAVPGSAAPGRGARGSGALVTGCGQLTEVWSASAGTGGLRVGAESLSDQPVAVAVVLEPRAR